MKTPDEIKNGLECCKEDECFGERENCPYTADPKLCVGVMCADALGYISQLESQNRCFKEIKESCEKRMIDMAQRMPGWISVEERLPEDGDDVAAIIRWNENVWEYGIAFRCNGKWLVNGEGIVTVTHWMPLPEPPKEENNNGKQ